MRDWTTVPLYGLATQKQIINCTDRELLSVYLGKGVVPFSSQAAKRTNVTSTDLSKYQAVDCGDFVLNNQQAWRGSVGVSRYSGIVSPAYIVLSLKDNISSGFADYLFQSRPMVDKYVVCSKGVGTIQRNIYWDYLKRVSVPLPPREEQDQIVRYLDWKVSLINKLINAKRRQITLLQEQKQAVINEAVTKGLNSKIALCDSKISSIGFTPQHWQMKSFNKLFLIKAGGDVKEELYSESLSEDYCYPVFTNNTNSNSVYAYTKTPYFPADSITVTGRGDVGHAIYRDTPFDAIIRLLVLIPKEKLNCKYFVYAINSTINFLVSQTAVKQLSAVQIAPYKICVPPISEQDEIALHLDTKCTDINKIINLYANEISLLTEYRTRLISDVVTGKLDIRGVAVPEYEAVEEAVDIALSEDDEIEAVVDEESTPETLVAKRPATAAKSKGHNQYFDDAVMIAAIVDAFYHDKYPLGRKKTQKLLYLLRRHQEESTSAFKKKAAGPYADEIRYKGGEPIAVSNKYIKTTSATGKGTTFSKGANLSQALDYIERWGITSDIQWLVEQFRFTSVDILELYATVDMAICDLTESNIPVSLTTIKNLIETNAEWKAKLKKQTFSDEMINKAIVDLAALI